MGDRTMIRNLFEALCLRMAIGILAAGAVILVPPGANAAPCDEADTVGGGTLGNSPGAVDGLGWDVGSGQCNGSFTVTRDEGFPSVNGGGIELGMRAEERRVGQVTNGGGDYEVETGNDANAPAAFNRAWWNFQHSIAYDGNINDLDALIFTIHTDVGPNLPSLPSFDMLAIRGIIDDRHSQPNATATYSDLYQTSQNPEFLWFTTPADGDVNPTGAFDYDEEGAWRLTLTAEKDGHSASVSICVHTPNAQCLLPDHFQCYKAKGERINVNVDLEDQFGVEPQVRVGKPDLFCNPVDKNGEGILDPAAHLTCYKIKKKGEDRVVEVENQFGVQTLEVGDAKLLCVPSEKISVAPADDDSSDGKSKDGKSKDDKSSDDD